MLALYRCGRHAEALDVFQTFRRMLDDELGIDPSPRLKELERRMLQQDRVARPRLRGAGRRSRPCDPRRSPAFSPRLVEPVAGRERELTHLERLHDEAQAGARRLVFVTGEAGIGKTTDRREPGRASRARRRRRSSLTASASSTVAPASRTCPCWRRSAGSPASRAAQQLVPLLARQAPTWLAQMPWLLADDELEAVQRRLIGATHQRMLREMLETLEAISHELTLVLVLEDLHWSDPSTVDLLDALARRREPARLLVVGTYRRGDAVAQEHPVHRLARELRGRGLCTEIAVGPLSRTPSATTSTARLGADASPEVSAVLRERTGGNPLFVTTLLDSWLEQRPAGRRRARPRAPVERRTGHGSRADRADARAARPGRPRASLGRERGRAGVLGRRRRGRDRALRGRGRRAAATPSRARAGSSSRPARSGGRTGRSQPGTASRTTCTERCSTSDSRPDSARRHTGESASGSRPPTGRARGRSRPSSPSTSCRRATPDAPSYRCVSRPSRRSSGSRIERRSST